MAKEQKTNLYLLSIVGIVAIVGIVVLVLNAGTGGMYVSSGDLSGEAVKSGSSLKFSALSSLKPGIILIGASSLSSSARDESCCGASCDACHIPDEGACKCLD